MESELEGLHPNPTVVTQLTPEGAVLLEMNSGDCYELNRSGAEIWTRLKEGDTFAAVVASVAKRHAIPEAAIEKDARELVMQLLKRGLLTTAKQ